MMDSSKLFKPSIFDEYSGLQHVRGEFRKYTNSILPEYLYISDEKIHGDTFKILVKKKSRSNLTAIQFFSCAMVTFPSRWSLVNSSQGLMKNLTHLTLCNCQLKEIARKNLDGLPNLNSLIIAHNQIVSLPPGLFEGTPNLEFVSFEYNHIKYVDKNILNPLRILKFLSLIGNIRINSKFDLVFNEGLTLDEMKTEIAEKCGDIWKHFDDLKDEVFELKKICADQKREIAVLKELQERPNEYDFTVTVNGKHFQVNKELLTSNSPAIAELINENKDADRLELEDVSVESFREILNFMNTKNISNKSADFIEIYAASRKLQMKDLTLYAEDVIIKEHKINCHNVMLVLKLCKQFNEHGKLQQEAVKMKRYFEE